MQIDKGPRSGRWLRCNRMSSSGVSPLGDSRAAREPAKWMRRDELRRRRTQVEVAGIRRGYRGTGLDARTRPVSDRARR